AYDVLLDYCDEMARSTYILSTTAIKNLLRFIANTPCLYKYVEKCNSSIRFKEEYSKFFGDTGVNIPQNPMAVVSVVTALLFDFDRNNVDIDRFLRKFYKSEDYGKCYQAFCNSVLVAYARAFGGVLDYKEKVVEGEEEKPIDNGLKDQCVPYVNKMMRIVDEDSNLSDEAKEETLTMLDGLIFSFDLSRAKIINAMWIGLNALIKKYRPVQSYLREVKKILEDYALI
ncbi:MAG: hypothetical protein K2G37_01285, partial [Clostridia bacterium]|nr:hypothetical protein [Clostridia bacterium]